jgi:tetratricopeptide (TPR) repeat protein
MTQVLNPTLLDSVEFEDASGPTLVKRRGTVVELLGGTRAPAVLIEVVDSEGVPVTLTARAIEEVKTVWRISEQPREQSAVPEAQEAYEKGLIFLQNRAIDRAREQFSRAFALDPKLAGSLSNLTSHLAEKGGFDPAIFIYQLILELRPQYTIARENLAATFVSRGIDFARRGLVDRAIDDFNSALLVKASERVTEVAQKNLVVAYTQLGVAHTDLRQYQEAIGFFVRAFEIHPFEATAKNLALALVAHVASARTGRPKLPWKELFKRAMQIGLTFSECLNAYGATLANLGWTSEGQSVLESAVKADPQNQIARENLNRLLAPEKASAPYHPGFIPLEHQPIERAQG